MPAMDAIDKNQPLFHADTKRGDSTAADPMTDAGLGAGKKS
ncbi:hypothetical protein QCE73_24295 [Caballeronia sp. LZ029]|nr:hypothetical protein [Caballeronia sp. LZ029]MDR5746300.1 hypothetical protein [Caballeronia sp. LZ029]